MLSILKRKDSPAPAGAVDEAASVQGARTRARRRLIGAVVLLGVAIVGFPLIFETRPRPMAVDIPIEVRARDGAVVPAAATPKNAAPAGSRAAAPKVAERAVERGSAQATEAPIEPAPPVIAAPPMPSPASAASALASASASAAASAPAAARAGSAVAALRSDRAASAGTVNRVAPVAADTTRDAQRAQALLDGKPAAAKGSLAPVEAAAASQPVTARFVVQAGAYTDATALRDARQKLEKLGMKTYTQVVDTESGARTRVRVGPFATRDEADKAAARIKASGLAANVLSL